MSVFEPLSRRASHCRRGVRLLIALAACAVGAGGCSSRTFTVVDSSLIGLWHFDEAPGSAMAMDSSGNGNHGTLVALDPNSVWVPDGRFGNALAVEAAGYVVVPATTSIDRIVTQVTTSAWIYFEGTVVDYGTALSRQIGTTIDQHYHLSVFQNEGYPTSWVDPAGTARDRAEGKQPVSKGVWTHLAGTYDGATAILYVDGTPVDARAVTGPFDPDTTPLILGGNGNNQIVSELFPGRIDEVALYNRALTASEIQRLAAAPVF